MSLSLSNGELILNIKRQAKRLSKSLSISLGHAQEALSIVIYDCDGWSHLLTSVKSKMLENEVILLSALNPKAEALLYKLLNNNMSNIIARFKERFPEFDAPTEIEKLIVNLFGIELSDFERKTK